MADISQEIDDFKSAIYGEEVRDSMVSLAQKLNTEVEANTTNVNQAVSTANSASSAANQAVQDANTTLQAANQAVKNAAGSASAAAGSASAAAGSAENAAESATAASGSASAAAQSAANAAEVAEGLGGFNGKASSVKAEDTQDLLGSEGEETNVQALIDYIADQVKNQLVSDSALTDKLANYILKNQIINNLLATQAGNVLDATQGKALSDMIGDTSQLPEGAENLVGAVTQLNSDYEKILEINDLTGSGIIPGFSNYKEFIVMISASGYITSHYLKKNMIVGASLCSSYYYSHDNSFQSAMAAINITAEGTYLLAPGMLQNSPNSSVIIYAK